MPRNEDAYVRAMVPSELPMVIDVLTRAFTNDPTMCFYGGVPALVVALQPVPSRLVSLRSAPAVSS